MPRVPPIFHRHAGDYLSAEEWGDLLRADERVARVLGAEPLPDARYLLRGSFSTRVGSAFPDPGLSMPKDADTPVARGEGERESPGDKDGEAGVGLAVADFAVRLTPGPDAPRTAGELLPYFSPDVRARLDFPRLLFTIPSRRGGERVLSAGDAPANARVLAVTLVWSLPDLLSIGSEREATGDLHRFAIEVGRLGVGIGMTATALTDPGDAARRAVGLRALLRKVGGQSELRLLSGSGSFASRDVWRAVYSLGLIWGNLDLFHFDGGTGTSRFRVLSSGNPPYFLPERAAEGERVPGIVLEYDLPRSPDPLAALDQMAIALSYLRVTLGGHPVTRRGTDLDAETLDAERDALEAAVQAMTNAGIAPGSDAAARFF